MKKQAAELETHLDRIPCYAYEGGFRIEAIPFDKVNIKIVGMGFEARETSEYVHEEYNIPWQNLPKVRAAKRFRDQEFVDGQIISQADYRRSAKSRLDFLVDGFEKFPVHLVLDYLNMKEYTRIGDGIEEKIVDIFLDDTPIEAFVCYGEIISGHIKSWGHPKNTPTYWY